MKITALTYNFIGIPIFSQKYFRRLNVFIKELAKLQPDIICLQEIWLDSAKMKIIGELKGLGYSVCYPSLIVRFCGLLTFCRGNVLSHEFVSTKSLFAGLDLSILELLGSKGYLLTKIDLYGQTVYLINLHLNADFSGNYRENSSYTKIQEKAIETLMEEMNKFKDEKILLVGDFNFQPNTFLYKRLINFGLNDVVFPGSITFLGGLLKIFLPNSGGRTDYIFTKNISKEDILDVKIVWDKPIEGVGMLSDHAGILATINIE